MVAVSLKKSFFQAEDGILDKLVTGVQTCALPILYPDQQKVVADMLDDENIKSSGSMNNRSNMTNEDESTNVNPRQIDYSRDSSGEQQILDKNS